MSDLGDALTSASTGTDLKASGSVLKGISSVAAGDSKENLERLNAQIADQQAKSEMSAGAYNANVARQKAASITGQQVASIGANNLQQSGTNANVVADTAAARERDALMINNNALRRAWGFEVQGASDKVQAGMAERGGVLSGIGDLGAAAGDLYK